jgi:hypothetical protein
VAYGARLESGLGETPQGFKSPILRQKVVQIVVVDELVVQDVQLLFATRIGRRLTYEPETAAV